MAEYDTDRTEVLEEAKRVLSGVVICGAAPADAQPTLELAAAHPGFIFVTLGLHPIYVEGRTDQEIEQFAEFISAHRRAIVGIGEIGLDYYWVKEPMKLKRTKEVFVEFLGLANELRLPVVLHLRGTGSEAIEEGLKIIMDEDVKSAIFHCFTGKPAVAEAISAEGYYVSLPTSIVRSKSMKKVAKRLPLSSLFTETDSPYLAITENERNVPQNVTVVYEEIARQQKLTLETVDAAIERNFEHVFGVALR